MAQAVPEGLSSLFHSSHIIHMITPALVNPSVKNRRFLTAPFTQGSLWLPYT